MDPPVALRVQLMKVDVTLLAVQCIDGLDWERDQPEREMAAPTGAVSGGLPVRSLPG
jgi:hypothetical protein